MVPINDTIDGTTQAMVQARLYGWTVIKPRKEMAERQCS